MILIRSNNLKVQSDNMDIPVHLKYDHEQLEAENKELKNEIEELKLKLKQLEDELETVKSENKSLRQENYRLKNPCFLRLNSKHGHIIDDRMISGY